jgi:hypothetical protein
VRTDYRYHSLSQVFHESWWRRAYSHPVRGEGAQGIGEELVGGHLQGMREGPYCGFFLMAIEDQPIDHGIGVITAGTVFRHTLIANQECLHQTGVKLYAFRCQNSEQCLRDVHGHFHKAPVIS